MALTRWPTEPHQGLLSWEIWKLRGEPKPRPTNFPLKVPQYFHEFHQWTVWRRKNRPDPRPDIIKVIPKWAYNVLKLVMIAVPLHPPPPPPQPGTDDPADSWKLPYPIMYTSWGPAGDSGWRDNDEGLRRCVAAGMKTVAFQGGNFRPIHAEWARDLGLRVAVWGSPGSQDASYLSDAEADGYIVQVETPDEYHHAVLNLQAGVGAGLSLAMVTTFGGLFTYTSRNVGKTNEHPTTVETEVLAGLGCTHAQVECYLGDMTPMSVEQMMHTGTRWRGLYYSKPVIGLAGREQWSVDSYKPAIEAYGRQFGVYLAEPMREVDWLAVKAL